MFDTLTANPGWSNDDNKRRELIEVEEKGETRKKEKDERNNLVGSETPHTTGKTEA